MYEKAHDHFERRHQRKRQAVANPLSTANPAAAAAAAQGGGHAVAPAAAAATTTKAAAAAAAATTQPAAAAGAATTSAAAVVANTKKTKAVRTTTADPAAAAAASTVGSAIAVTTKAAAAASSAVVATKAITPASVATTPLVGVASASLSQSISGASATNASASKSTSHTGAIAGAIIGVLALIALGVGGFFFWRKRRNNSSSRNSAQGFIGGSGYQRQFDEPKYDAYGNNTNANPFNEKPSYGTYGAAAAVGAGAGALAAHAYDRNQQQQQQPAWNNHNQYPPASSQSGGSNRSISPPAQSRYEAPLPVAPAPVAPVAAPNGPFAESEGQGDVRIVKRSFEPSSDMDDELWIQPGDRVQILMAYDDGWSLCRHLNHKPGQGPIKGVIPNDCIDGPGAQSGGKHLSDIREEDGSSPSSSAAAPQLAPFRTDSPSLSDQFSRQQQQTPAIHIATPSMTDYESMTRPANNGNKVKRTSSLIASRDANLFVELGRALDSTAQSHQQQYPSSNNNNLH